MFYHIIRFLINCSAAYIRNISDVSAFKRFQMMYKLSQGRN